LAEQKRVFLTEWGIDLSWNCDESPKVLSVKFGDGYEQRIGDGINNSPMTFIVSFKNNFTTSKIIRQFFVDHGGEKSFVWKTPYESVGLYIAKKWSFSPIDSGLYMVSTTFEQVFEGQLLFNFVTKEYYIA